MHRRWRDAPTPDAPGMFPKAKDEDGDQGSGIGDQEIS
jgi:hypothetical protein